MVLCVSLPCRAVHSVTLLVLAFSTALLLQPAGAQLTPSVCPYSQPAGVSWALIMNYSNNNASRYGNLNTTLCQCVQACLDLPGCSGFDWYLYGTHTKCWLANNCPAMSQLSYDATNNHYVPTSMVSCYPGATWSTSAGMPLNRGVGVLLGGILTTLHLMLK